MANQRTVDPAGLSASTKMVSFRITQEQIEQMDMLAGKWNCSRSTVLRRLVSQAAAREAEPDPF